MLKNFRLALVLVVAGAMGNGDLQAQSAPVRPGVIIVQPLPAIVDSEPRQISGRAVVVTGRERRGVTVHSGTAPFATGSLQARPDGYLSQTRKFGDNTVITGRDREGVTRAGATNTFGVSPLTRRPVTVGRSGLSTLHTPGRALSGFKRFK